MSTKISVLGRLFRGIIEFDCGIWGEKIFGEKGSESVQYFKLPLCWVLTGDVNGVSFFPRDCDKNADLSEYGNVVEFGLWESGVSKSSLKPLRFPRRRGDGLSTVVLSCAWMEGEDTEDPLEPLSKAFNLGAFSISLELTDRNDSAAEDAGLDLGGTGEHNTVSSSIFGICDVSIDGDIERDALA